MWRETATKPGRRRAVARWLAVALVLLVVTSSAAYAFGKSRSLAGISPEDKKAVALYAEALDTVEEDYVDQKAVDPKEQTYGAIRGMLGSLGDEGHTRFLTPGEVESNRRGLSGRYVGIGVQLSEENGDDAVISSPVEGSPADGAGIESGDVVVAVDGKDVRNEDVTEVAEKIRGPEGSRVELTVLRDGEERRFTMERAELELPAVSWALVPGSKIADVRLASFTDDSAGELEEALGEARAAGAERFILDLRNNPGGRLDQAIEIASDFLAPGSVVYIRKDSSGEREEIKVSDDAEPTNSPMVVLVNGGSASSAEILAGALRDNGRAKVIGTTTYGTGTVLSEFTLDDGSAILLGIAEWLTPNGDFIRETGIEPDIKVEEDEPLTPDDVRDLSRAEILDRDAQLERAFETLSG